MDKFDILRIIIAVIGALMLVLSTVYKAVIMKKELEVNMTNLQNSMTKLSEIELKTQEIKNKLGITESPVIFAEKEIRKVTSKEEIRKIGIVAYLNKE